MVAMALSIKTEEADRLARELAEVTGESLTEAVTEALRERLSRLRVDKQEYVDRLRRLGDEYASHPIDDPRSADEILGYDEHGLPS
jgi:antitoxin VapB